MTDITIIGSGNMARGIGTWAVAAGRSLQILSRDEAGAADLAAELGGSVTSGSADAVPAGSIVVLAVPYDAAREIVTRLGAALAAPGVTIVKAFNTTFAGPLSAGTVAGEPLDVFIASDSEEASAAVASFVGDAGLRPVVTGPLRRARELEAFQLLVMTLQANPAFDTFNWNTSLKVLV